jgi:hypothetical protein
LMLTLPELVAALADLQIRFVAAPFKFCNAALYQCCAMDLCRLQPKEQHDEVLHWEAERTSWPNFE